MKAKRYLLRRAAWAVACYAALFFALDGLGVPREAAAIIVPALVVLVSAAHNLRIGRFYRGIHRREGTAGQARFRGPVRRAGAAGSRCRAGRRACACARCTGPGLTSWPPVISQGLRRAWQARLAAYSGLPCEDNDPEPRPPALPGGIRLHWVPDPLIIPPYLLPGQLAVSPPSRRRSIVIAGGSGYTRGSQVPAHVRPASMSQQLPPFPHPATCRCVACTYVPAARPRRAPPGMPGFDGAPLVAGVAYGYRWWTLPAPALHLDPGDARLIWDAGLLRGMKDVWQPGVNKARCIPSSIQAGWHDEAEVPHEDCACGYWAYWEIQQHDTGAAKSLPVVGVVKASGQVIMGPRGFRAGRAEIVALHLPFRIEPALPSAAPGYGDYVTRAIPGSGRTMTHRRFTGKVVNYGTSYVPAPLAPPPEPEPPSDEEIAAAKDRAEAWMAVIEERLAETYPGAEVCATLNLMKAKYPVKSEYAPPQPVPVTVRCPLCGMPCDERDILRHITSIHRI